tara:strand:+ start:26684 stop:27754 length:1071 start_codon:yes stop_codon:yes gene_type:complete
MFFKSSVTSDNKFIDKDTRIIFCENCGYISIDPDYRLDFSKFYQEDYDFLLDQKDLEPEFLGQSISSASVKFCKDLILDNEDKKLIDVGAGKGNILDAIHQECPKIQKYGLEPSRSYLNLKEKKYLKKTYNEFLDPSLFNNQKFDFIITVGVLEHVDSPVDFLKDIKSIMSDDAVLVVEVPNFEKSKFDLLTADHFSKFTSRSIRNLFLKSNFEIIKQEISEGLFMRFALVNNQDVTKEFESVEIETHLRESKKAIENAISVTRKYSQETIAVYGQSIILDYLIGTGLLSYENIDCIIDDNSLYQGLKYKSKVDIISFEEFEKRNANLKIFLSMNDCYYKFVLPKLASYKIINSIN